MKKFLEILKWTVWVSALVGSVWRVVNFSRTYMRNNIGFDNMRHDRYYLTICTADTIVFISDIYSKSYIDAFEVLDRIRKMSCVLTYEWELRLYPWGWPRDINSLFQVYRFNELPIQLISPNDRWAIWRQMLTLKAFNLDFEMPEVFTMPI